MSTEDKSYKIADIKAWPPGTAVPKIQGLIKACKPQEEKTGNYGPYMSQWAVLAQGGEEITLYIDEQPPVNKGDAVTIACVTVKNKLTGVTTYNKGDKWALNVRKNALVMSDAPGAARTPVAQQQPQTKASYAPPSPNPVNATQSGFTKGFVGTPSQLVETFVGKAQEHDILGQLSALWNACRRESEKNPTFKEEVIQSKTSCLFIEGCRQQLWKDYVPEPRPLDQAPQAPALYPPVVIKNQEDLEDQAPF